MNPVQAKKKPYTINSLDPPTTHEKACECSTVHMMSKCGAHIKLHYAEMDECSVCLEITEKSLRKEVMIYDFTIFKVHVQT